VFFVNTDEMNSANEAFVEPKQRPKMTLAMNITARITNRYIFFFIASLLSLIENFGIEYLSKITVAFVPPCIWLIVEKLLGKNYKSIILNC